MAKVAELRRIPASAWLVAVVVACVAYVVVLELSFTAFLDICDENHESLNSPSGYLLSGLFLTAHLVLAVLARHRVSPYAVIVGVAIQLALVAYVTTPMGSCY